MIGAFQDAFRKLQERADANTKAIRILGHANPEVLKLLQVQPEEGADEVSSGDAKPRILPLPGHGDDSGAKDESESNKDTPSS